jgi:hypothetical protein
MRRIELIWFGSPLPEGEGRVRGKGWILCRFLSSPLIRPAATFSLREKGIR